MNEHELVEQEVEESYDKDTEKELCKQGIDNISHTLDIQGEIYENNPEVRNMVEGINQVTDKMFDELQLTNPDITHIKNTFFDLVGDLVELRLAISEKFSANCVECQEVKSFEGAVRSETTSLFQELFNEEMLNINCIDNGQNLSFEQIEESANYEGNKTLLMVERLRNEEINNQLVQLLYLDKKYNLQKLSKTSQSTVKEKALEMISDVSNHTPITFTSDSPESSDIDGVRESMGIFFDGIGVLSVYGNSQKNIAEAHEKGHTIRKVKSAPLMEYLTNSFDFDVMEVPDGRINSTKKYILGSDPKKKELSDNEVVEGLKEYLMDPMELIERMSQLKNYFGISDNSIFTKEHLNYARLHYVEDTKLDNNMTEFFSIITSKTEDSFLDSINKCGI